MKANRRPSFTSRSHGRDYFMIANDKIATLANPDAVSQIGVYRLTEIREGKSVILSKPLQRADR